MEFIVHAKSVDVFVIINFPQIIINHLVEPAVGQVEVGGSLVCHGPVEHPVEEGDIHVEVLR